jgi:hypothetical protein
MRKAVVQTESFSAEEWSGVYYVVATDYERYVIMVGCPEITTKEREY